MTQPWQLYILWGVVVAAGTGAISLPLGAMIANRWFVERRGLVTGILTASNATGQLIFLPALAWIVGEWGWRYAAAAGGVVALVAVLPLTLVFIRDRPADLGLPPYGGTEVVPAPPSAGNPLVVPFRVISEVRRSTAFWLLAGSFFICGASTNGLIGTHLIPAAMDHGFGEVAAASLLATVGAFDLVGTICSGWLTDRYDPRLLLAWYYGLRGLSLLALPYAFGSPHFGLILFVIFYGLDWVATVPPTVALTSEIFGAERVGVVFGWIFAAHMFGASAAAWGAGAVRTCVRRVRLGLRNVGPPVPVRRRARDADQPAPAARPGTRCVMQVAGLPFALHPLGRPAELVVGEDTLRLAAGPRTDWFVDPATGASTANAPALVGAVDGDFLLAARVEVGVCRDLRRRCTRRAPRRDNLGEARVRAVAERRADGRSVVTQGSVGRLQLDGRRRWVHLASHGTDRPGVRVPRVRGRAAVLG